MKALPVVAALAALLSLTAPSTAAGISLGKPAYGGTGCPQGSASVSLDSGGKTLSLLFKRYAAEAGGSSGRSSDRKACSLAIPVKVPAGQSVSVLAVDYRGYNILPAGGTSQFDVEYFFAGSSGPKFTKTFTGPVSGPYLIKGAVVVKSSSWSACGADVILRTNSSLRVTTKANKEALATVDSQRIKAAIVYTLQWKAC